MSENHDLTEDKLNRKEEISFLITYLTKSLKEELEKEYEVIYFDACVKRSVKIDYN